MRCSRCARSRPCSNTLRSPLRRPAPKAPLQPLPQAQSAARPNFPATVFVFHDGHEMEVRDYAILGDTLWGFSEQTAPKFPLADFNIAASRQVNEEHGIEFPVSRPHQR